MHAAIAKRPEVTKIVAWGATGHVKVLREFCQAAGYTLVAVFDNRRDLVSPFADVPIFYGQDGFAEWKRHQQDRSLGCTVAIGGWNGRDRVEIQDFLQSQGLSPVVLAHPTAYVAASVQIGRGSQILAGSIVGVDCVLGTACIINTRAHVDHECRLGEGVHIAPGAAVAGCVEIADYSLIGAGAVLLPRIRIGRNVVIGAGSVVTRDVPDDVVAYGNPARIIRPNHP